MCQYHQASCERNSTVGIGGQENFAIKYLHPHPSLSDFFNGDVL
jgi:hypothetical protein